MSPLNAEGQIELIVGTMFGGKSTELLRRLERSLIAGQKVLAFSRDQRFETGCITTHSKITLEAHTVTNVDQIKAVVTEHPDVKVIGIDEVQFFDPSLVAYCDQLALDGIRVICAGLDQDYESKPFKTTVGLVSEAEYVDKMSAICVSCGALAVRNRRKNPEEVRVLEGASEAYEALCRRCYHDDKMKEVIDGSSTAISNDDETS